MTAIEDSDGSVRGMRCDVVVHVRMKWWMIVVCLWVGVVDCEWDLESGGATWWIGWRSAEGRCGRLAGVNLSRSTHESNKMHVFRHVVCTYWWRVGLLYRYLLYE
jgi:hypothetical protein